MLGRQGQTSNHKRVYRWYPEEGLSVHKRGRKRVSREARIPLAALSGPSQLWSLEFVADTLSRGRKIRMLPVVDAFSRESLATEVDTWLPGVRVARVLDRIVDEREAPEAISLDNGPELTSRALDQWAHERGVRLRFIDPGKPQQKGFIESFNGRLVTSASTSTGSSRSPTPAGPSNTGGSTTITTGFIPHSGTSLLRSSG